MFDLDSQVYDVEWASFSSTVFAAVTTKDLVIIYDLTIDKNEALYMQPVIFLKSRLVMNLVFKSTNPVILV